MAERSMVRMAGAIVVAIALSLGAAAPTPAGADPSDVYLPVNTWSPQYDLGGCLYKVAWGHYYNVPFTVVRFYNPSTCGSAVVVIQYLTSAGVLVAHSTAVNATGTDGCGAYQQIQATPNVAGIPLRGLVWVLAGARWYANDGLDAQPIHAHC